MISAEFAGLKLDTKTGDTVMLIRRTDDSKVIPIWIGQPEAFSIAMALSGFKPPRPLTHDLLLSVVEAMGGKLSMVVISGLRENTYYALLHIDRGDVETYVVDARPSDSIALAVRAKCPIYVSEEVPAYSLDDPEDEIGQELVERLKDLNPEDFLNL